MTIDTFISGIGQFADLCAQFLFPEIVIQKVLTGKMDHDRTRPFPSLRFVEKELNRHSQIQSFHYSSFLKKNLHKKRKK